MSQTDFYVPDNILRDFKADQTVLIKKHHLPFLSNFYYTPEEPFSDNKNIDWYPYVNSYYSYTEDVDAFARVNHLKSTQPSLESIVSDHFQTYPDNDSYSEKDAQLQYLQSKPVCFFITGKPEIGQRSLGKNLAEFWNCVYLDPEILIEDEIKAQTRAGQCIEFNLRSGRAIGIDVILRLLEKRLKTQTVEHRGFVIAGFPLIPNELYEEDPVSSETAIFTVQDIFEEIFDTVLEVGVPPVVRNVSIAQSKVKGEGEESEEEKEEAEEEEEKLGEEEGTQAALPAKPEPPVDIGEAKESICRQPEIGVDYEEQLNFIFSQFEKPYFIIYIMCPNADVISKRNQLRFDFISHDIVDLLRERAAKTMFTVYSQEPGATYEEIPEGIIHSIFHQNAIFQQRLLTHLPRDFPACVVSQLEKYHYNALPAIERHVLLHDPQFFIKIDGRVSITRMFNVLRTKLRTMPIQKVLIPQRCVNDDDDLGEGGGDTNFEGLTPEECFENLQKRKIIHRMFKWGLSDWGFKCPVSMKSGIYVEGNPKCSVQFMNKIFFLKDEEAVLDFTRNPRPYLLPPYPKVSCRIFIFGPKYSGKTAIAKCLSYMLRGEIIDPIILQREYLQQRLDEFLDGVRTNALNEAIGILNRRREDEWRRRELDRQEKVKEWLKFATHLVQFRPNVEHVEEDDEEDDDDDIVIEEISSFAMKLSRRKIIDRKTKESIFGDLGPSYTRSQLLLAFEEHGLPFFDNTDLCTELSYNPEKLLEYVPIEIKNPLEQTFEPATVFDEFVSNYARKAVENCNYEDIPMTTDNLFEMLVTKIKQIEEDNERNGLNRGGWIVDGMLQDRELLERLLPEFIADDIFVLLDDPEHHFLAKRFGKVDATVFTDYRNFFFKIRKNDAAWRCPPSDEQIGEENKSFNSEDDFVTIQGEETDVESVFSGNISEKPSEIYRIHLEEYYKQWEETATFFEENELPVSAMYINDKSLEDVMMDVIKKIEDQNRQLGSIFSPEDRVQELEDFGEQGGEEMEEEEGEEPQGNFLNNRRYGDTYHFCPVTFHNHWVLWRGKEEFGAKFLNKLYFMCSESAMNEFIDNPRKFLLLDKAPHFPPPRICIVGPTGSGKTTIAEAISRNLGLFYTNFEDELKNLINPNSNLKLTDLIKETEEGGLEANIDEYLNADIPLPENMMESILLKWWFHEPEKTIGFVMDDFPKRPTDIDFMERHSLIPDVILEIAVDELEFRRRTFARLLEEWTIKNEVLQKLQNEEHQRILNEWQESRQQRFTELLEVKREKRYAAKVSEATPESPLSEPNEKMGKSQVSFDSLAEAADLEEIEQILYEEFPEPELEDQLETIEEASERFYADIDLIYSADIDFIHQTKENAINEQIPWTILNGSVDEKRVIAEAYRETNQYKLRNRSFFERCYDISVEMAEKLLEKGFYFLSKFGRTCPVQSFEKRIMVQMYLPHEKMYTLFPIIHRDYIYFIGGKESKEKFKSNPLKYIHQKDFKFPLIPMRIAITGPPHSGKTCLAERFSREYGFKVVTRGSAARFVLKYLPYCSLAENMEFVLRKGWELTDEMVIRCVEAIYFDSSCLTQGIVMDGFPNSVQEVKHLASIGLVPNLVIDLQASAKDCYNNLLTREGKKNLPRYSQRFMNHRFIEWAKVEDEFKDWLDSEYQILAKIPINTSMWGVWTAANALASDVFSEIKHYYHNIYKDWPLRVSYMLVTPLEFLERRRIDYKSYCPCCLYFDNALVSGGDPPDRTGLVHYRQYIYWLCHSHINIFIACPDKYLPPYNYKVLPPFLPERVKLSEFPENTHEDGLCVVCFDSNRPKHVFRKGVLQYGILYREKYYFFDTLSCMNRFCKEPHLYFNIHIHFKQDCHQYPSLSYKELPTLGLLEQYVAKQVIKAVTATGRLRPIIPGLSISVAAAIHSGLILKINNPSLKPEYLQLYREALRLFEERYKSLMAHLDRMKKTINPYLYYEEPMPRFRLPEEIAIESQTSLEKTVSELKPPSFEDKY